MEFGESGTSSLSSKWAENPRIGRKGLVFDEYGIAATGRLGDGKGQIGVGLRLLWKRRLGGWGEKKPISEIRGGTSGKPKRKKKVAAGTQWRVRKRSDGVESGEVGRIIDCGGRRCRLAKGSRGHCGGERKKRMKTPR